jgi:hypothetical protein
MKWANAMAESAERDREAAVAASAARAEKRPRDLSVNQLEEIIAEKRQKRNSVEPIRESMSFSVMWQLSCVMT